MKGRWPFLGLLVVALFLGHDTLMVLEVIDTERVLAAATQHTAEESTSPVHGSAPEPKHPGNCGIGFPALPRSSNNVAGLEQVLLQGDPFVESPLCVVDRVAPLAWEEPHRPPGRLRALVQVYRM